MGYRVIGDTKDVFGEYQSRVGLEGPFYFESRGVLYYDPKEGKYWDPKTDFYLSNEETDLLVS